MSARALASLLLLVGLGLLLIATVQEVPFGSPPMTAGSEILADGPDQVGSANLVTSVVLAYRGLDTLIELTILFVAATAIALILGVSHGAGAGVRAEAAPAPASAGSSVAAAGSGPDEAWRQPAGFVLRTAADVLFPVLLILGSYIVLHGHLSPGGGFQGGVILATAFFLPLLARPGQVWSPVVIHWIEGLAGAFFIVLGLLALVQNGAFLAPLGAPGALGTLLSAGSLPLLYLAVGLKVGAELAGVLGAMFTAPVGPAANH